MERARVEPVQEREPSTALKNLADFVARDMPRLLSEEPKKLALRADEVCGDLDFVRQNPGCMVEGLRRQTALNLKMIEAALAHSKVAIPQSVTSLIDTLVPSSEVRGLTYEDVVITNCEPQLHPMMKGGMLVGLPGTVRIRTFTTGRVRGTEESFYKYHADIEVLLGTVIRQVQHSLKHLSGGNAPAAAQACRGAEATLNKVVALTVEAGKMTHGDFPQFRHFLSEHPTRGTRGASGAFTAKMPTLELLLRGAKNLAPSHLGTIRDNYYYFPRDDRPALLAAERGQSLSELYLATGRPPELLPVLEMLDAFFAKFRAVHYGAVSRQTPDVLTGGEGTGGFTKDFLKDRRTQRRPWDTIASPKEE